MRIEKFSFGRITIDGVTYEHDVVIDHGKVRKRKKKPSKEFRDAYSHTPVSTAEEIPWKCRCLVIGTGANGKGVFLNTLRAIWADYAVVAPMETFDQRVQGLARPRVSPGSSTPVCAPNP